MRISLFFFFTVLFVTERKCSSDDLEESIREDGILTMPELVNKYGYPIETHQVTTKDGYILTLYRIPFGRKCPQNPAAKVPVLVQHGLLMSSFDWVILGPEKGLGYILADACYDVWMGNNRGNSQSRKHLIFNDKDPKFWDFSWHEMGLYDLPAMINYILSQTQNPRLHYIGHSEGTTQFFVFNSLYPEYKDRVISAHALSPVVFMKHLVSPMIRLSSLFQKSLQGLTNLMGMFEFAPESELLTVIGSQICKSKFLHLDRVCSNIMFLLVGFDEQQLDKTRLPAILGHTPSGASAKSMFHYVQGVRTGKFRQWDYGLIGNLKIYDSKDPPDYNLTQITIPTALYYGTNDWLASVTDVEALIKVLPNIIEVYKVPYEKWSHLDFLYATDVSNLLYSKVLEVMSRFH